MSTRSYYLFKMQTVVQNSIEPVNYSLSGNEALVFYGDISRFSYENWLTILSEEEILRAETYHLPLDRRSYVIIRGVLKRLLSHFSGVGEKEIAFDCGKNGKLFLSSDPDLQFNLSHAGEAFVIGLTRGREIGIDMEHLDRSLNISKLEAYLFTTEELQQFHNMEHSYRQEAFINSWTRKEAILKATGDGLTQPMNTLDVAFTKDGHCLLATDDQFPMQKTNWFLESCILMDNYRVSVAIKGQTDDLQYISANECGLFSHKVS